jgi:hypothetical protein
MKVKVNLCSEQAADAFSYLLISSSGFSSGLRPDNPPDSPFRSFRGLKGSSMLFSISVAFSSRLFPAVFPVDVSTSFSVFGFDRTPVTETASMKRFKPSDGLMVVARMRPTRGSGILNNVLTMSLP